MAGPFPDYELERTLQGLSLADGSYPSSQGSGTQGYEPRLGKGKSKKEKAPSTEKLRKSFRETILKLKDKKQAQMSAFKEISKILSMLEEGEQRASIILEKINHKDKIGQKTRKMVMNSIQIALFYKSIKIFRILLNQLDRLKLREYLETYELVDQAFMSLDDDQVGEVLARYSDLSIDIDPTRLCDLAQTCLHEGSWNQATIAALYPFMRSCFVPREQNKAKMYALVCYNTFKIETEHQKRRDGAEEEADCIIKALREYGCTVRRTLVDWLFEELLEYLDQQIEQIKNDCSVLFVCLMSHGDTGVIFDREGRKGEINKVLAKFHILNQILPVVTLIQACQGDREAKQGVRVSYTTLDGPQNDASNPDDPNNQQAWGPDNHQSHPDLVNHHISVQRPNTLVATASTEHTVAKRSVFLRQFAKELTDADGMTTINTMVQLSSRSMSFHHDKETREQAPTTYDLLRQPLVLPRSKALDRKQLQDPRNNLGTGTFQKLRSMGYVMKKLMTKKAKDHFHKT